jgi:thimet oligopeptidase
MRISYLLCVSVFLAGAASAATVKDFDAAVAEHKVTLVIPDYPDKPDEIKTAVDSVIANYTKIGDQVAAHDASKATFENTIAIFDAADNFAESLLSPISIVENASPNPLLRKVATDEFQRFQDFSIGFSYREDVYNAVKAYADTNPQLEGQQKRLFDEMMRDYKRRGFALSKEVRAVVEALQKEISKLGTDFDQNIRETDTIEKFTKAELKGLPEDFIASVKTGDDEYSFSAKISSHFSNIFDNAEVEETRKRMTAARSRHAMDLNLPILEKVVKLRSELANRLGYANWADYKTEDRMAGSEKTVRLFLDNLSRGLQPKFDAEVEALRVIKAAETGDATAVIHGWDAFYYKNKLLQEQYSIDLESLRVYFPYDACLKGMFTVYETIFGITITEIDNPEPWAPGVTLHAVTDVASGKPLGLFYLDMFPREGKYNHFAQFGIIPCKKLADGSQQRPTVSLICNFPTPIGDKPSLLSFDNVETLFHEFGHCMHSILTEVDYMSFSGTSVPRDFVEAPSQVLEYWIRDKQVLDIFAADYRDPSKKLPEAVLENMEKADLAMIALHYRGQIGYAMTDLLLHSYAHPLQVQNVAAVGNAALAQYIFARPEGTAFVAGFGHLMGYDAGYYGYAWSDVIAADMASLFENAEGKFMNQELGMKLRNEVFSRGDTRDVSESVEKFLGRERSMDAFLIKLGIK